MAIAQKPTIMDIAELLIKSGCPILFMGDPGVGKTSVMGALAKANDWDFEAFIASIRTPEELSGTMYVGDGQLKTSVPSWVAKFTDQKTGVFFIDELTTCAPTMQAALLRIINEGVIGDYTMPKTVYRVAACNGDNVSGTNTLSHPLANRFVHYNWSLNPDQWANGIVTNFSEVTRNPLPYDPNWKSKRFEYVALVSEFIKSNPTMLHKMPESEGFEGLAWASPRSWEMAIDMLAVTYLFEQANKEDEDGQYAMLHTLRRTFIEGTVGKEASDMFFAWMAERNLPKIADVVRQHDTFDFKSLRADVINVILKGVIGYTDSNPEDFKKSANIFRRVYEEKISPSVVVHMLPQLNSVIKKKGKNLSDHPELYQYSKDVIMQLNKN